MPPDGNRQTTPSLGKMLEQLEREKAENEERRRDNRDLDFTAYAPDPELEDEFFGGFKP
jgi:hypothetical protein